MLNSLIACVGAASHSAARPSGALMLFITLSIFISPVGATCVHCHGFFDGCTGSASCPLGKELTANVAAMETPSVSKVPQVGYALPPEMLTVFTKNVIETIVGIACSPATGQTIDFSDSAFTTSASVVRAAMMSHCTYEEATMELAERLEKEDEDIPLRKIQGSIDLLKASASTSNACMPIGQGLYTFIWAKVGQYIEAVKKGTVRLTSAAAKASIADLTATIKYPESQMEFMFMLNDWVLVIASLGLLSYPLVARFVKETVEYTMVSLKETYQVACCLFMTYLKRVETDPTRKLNLANVYRAGSSDTYLAEARQMAVTCFRSRGANPLDTPKGGDATKETKWNGKDTPTAKKPCAAFNFVTAHRAASLDATGCCKFAHKCNQWVDDKGPGGMCMGDHKKSDCDYPAAHKRDKPMP